MTEKPKSRESERQAAMEALAAADKEGGVARTNDLLTALTHAVLALTAPTEEQLKSVDDRAEFERLLEKGRG